MRQSEHARAIQRAKKSAHESERESAHERARERDMSVMTAGERVIYVHYECGPDGEICVL